MVRQWAYINILWFKISNRDLTCVFQNLKVKKTQASFIQSETKIGSSIYKRGYLKNIELDNFEDSSSSSRVVVVFVVLDAIISRFFQSKARKEFLFYI